MNLYAHYYNEVLKFRQTGRILQTSVELHDRLIKEERDEYDEAKAKRNQAMCADAIGDEIVTVMGKAIDIGMPYHEISIRMEDILYRAKAAGIAAKVAFDLVMESNYSKFVKASEIEATKQKYADLGVYDVVFTQCEGDLFVVYSGSDQEDKGKKKEYPKGKFLKSSGFFEPKFAESSNWKM